MARAAPTNPKDCPAWAAGLSDRERLFVEHYAACLNGAEAARKAGYSAKFAKTGACELRRRPRIAAAISAYVAENAGVTSAMVLDKLAAIATTNINDVAEVKDGQLVVKDTSELSPEALVAVSEYSLNDRGFLTVKLYDRIRALDLLSKVLGMKRSVNSEQPNVNVNVLQVNNANEAGDRVMARVNELISRQQALPAPTEQPIEIISATIKDIEHVSRTQ
jgi:phage terminase small subunit